MPNGPMPEDFPELWREFDSAPPPPEEPAPVEGEAVNLFAGRLPIDVARLAVWSLGLMVHRAGDVTVITNEELRGPSYAVGMDFDHFAQTGNLRLWAREEKPDAESPE